MLITAKPSVPALIQRWALWAISVWLGESLVMSGLDVAANDKVFPSEDRLMGEHAGLKDMVEKVHRSVYPESRSIGAKGGLK